MKLTVVGTVLSFLIFLSSNVSGDTLEHPLPWDAGTISWVKTPEQVACFPVLQKYKWRTCILKKIKREDLFLKGCTEEMKVSLEVEGHNSDGAWSKATVCCPHLPTENDSQIPECRVIQQSVFIIASTE